MPMQFTAIFRAVKSELNNFDIFPQNIDKAVLMSINEHAENVEKKARLGLFGKIKTKSQPISI